MADVGTDRAMGDGGDDASTSEFSAMLLADHGESLPATSLDDLVRRAAARWPDRLAWTFAELPGRAAAELTFEQLDVELDRVVAGLDAVGVRAGSHVGAMLTNVPEFALLWLALARAGAVIVPINPAYTARELDHVATTSEMTHLVIAEDRLDVLAAATTTGARVRAERVVVVGEQHSQPGSSSWRALLATAEPLQAGTTPPAPDALLNIQFTSGTTGLPKGCMLTQGYWVLLGVIGAEFAELPQRLLADHPFFYMQNQCYLAMSLWSGGQLIVTPGVSRSKFFDRVEEHAIDFTWWMDVMGSARPEDAARARTLRYVASDGVHGDEHETAEGRFGVTIRDWYASTELGMGMAVPRSRPDVMARPGAVGFPAPFREVAVVDAQLKPVAADVPGELLVRGPHIFRGYYGAPEATAASIVAGGWFRTGDLVRQGADGCVYYIGRKKDTINRSGENISAFEIEQVLRSLPDVVEAAAVGVPDDKRGQEVKAYIVLEEGAPAPEPAAFLAACAELLAPFKVPRYLEIRDELPMTGSGKVAKARLAEERADLRVGSYDRVDGRQR